MTPHRSPTLLGRLFALYVGRVPLHRGRSRVLKAFAWLLGEAVMPTPFGFPLQMPTGDRSTRVVLEGSSPRVAEAVRALKPGSCLFDVGANMGLFTVLGSKAVGTEGRVVAFEPQSLVFARLERNLALNACANVTAFKLAIAQTSFSSAIVPLKSNHSGSASIVAGGDLTVATETIDCARFADIEGLAALAGDRSIAVKIDVEGYELEVVRALVASPYLARTTMLMIEIDDALLARHGGSRAAIETELARHGFKPTVANPLPHDDEIFVRAARG